MSKHADQDSVLRTFLKDLKAQRAELDAAISVIERQLGSRALAKQGYRVAETQPVLFPTDTFVGLSIVRATLKYLGIVKRRQTTREISNALERGGFAHKAKNFYLTVYSVLRREVRQAKSPLVKTGNSWGLKEWQATEKKVSE